MLTGKRVDVRRVEKEDVATWTAWFNDPEFVGPYLDFPVQYNLAEAEKLLMDPPTSPAASTRFMVQTKDGKRVGMIVHFNPSTFFPWMEIGFSMVPGERGKGYAYEAVQIMLDYLFLTKDLPRVTATTAADNVPCQKVLLKAGFRKEGEMRKGLWNRGQWTDLLRFGILREEWKEPHVLQRR